MFAGAATHKDVSWVVPPLLIASVLYTLQHASSSIAPDVTQQILRRDEEARCPVDLSFPDACEQVRKYCQDLDSDALIPYARAYACTAPSIRPFLLLGMLIWLIVLFASMATAASEFLAVHLQYIVKTVGISENLAGVTVFAFGNGCTDLFSTFAAMGANSGSLAISELFGAAAFITTVVLGLIAWIQPFTVDPREFVGDVVWFIIAASLLLAFIADGRLVLGECIGIIGLYLSFIVFVLFRSKKTIQPTISLAAAEPYTDDAIGEAADDDLLELITDEAATDSGYSPFEDSQHAYAESRLVLAGTAPSLDDTSEHESLEAASSRPQESQGFAEDAEPLVESAALQDTSRASILKSFPPLYSWHEQSTGERMFTLLGLPLLFPIGLTTPPCISNGSVVFTSSPTGSAGTVSDLTTPTHQPSTSWHITSMARSLKTWSSENFQRVKQNWLLYVQLLLGPQFFTLVIVQQSTEESRPLFLLFGSSCALIVSGSLIYHATCFSSTIRSGLSISSLAFATSLTWIYLTATSAVSLLITLAWILNVPTSLLGATVFAVGQSSNDLFANTAIAKRGMPVLAASATFGGPMMNMLMGIGVGGLAQILKPGSDGVYTFETEVGTFASAACLLLGLTVTLGWVFTSQWRLKRELGATLILLWLCSAIINVTLSMTV